MSLPPLICRFFLHVGLVILAEYGALAAPGSPAVRANSEPQQVWMIPTPVPVSYDASTGEHFTLYAYEGERTVLLLPSTDYRTDLVQRAVTQMDWHWAFYVQVTGREPTPNRLYNGKPTLAVFDTGKLPGAAIGWIGATGVEFGLGTFKSWYNNLYTAPYDHHLVFAYEFGRNFYFYMGQLDHLDLVMREDWSHIFNFFVYSIGIKKWWALHDFPEPDQRWLENSRNYTTMVNYASSFMADSTSSFSGFKASKINGAIMTGFLLMLYEQYGDRFSQNFWQEVEKLPAPASAADVADKIYVAASRAAGENLEAVFQQQLRFPLSAAARALVVSLPVRSSLLPLSPAVQQIPVGASNRVLDPDFGFRNVAEWFFLQQYLPPVLPKVDSTNPFTGSPALHIAGFNPLPFPDKDNIYFRSYPLITDEAPRIYKFSGWVRASGLRVQDNYPGNPPWMLPILLFDDIIGTIASPDLLSGLKNASTNNGTFGWVRFETYACKRYVSQSNVYVDMRSFNKSGEVWLSDISVEVVDVPVIDTRPRLIKEVADQSVASGDPLTLSFGAGALNLIYYQWYKDDAPINGATISYYCMPQAGAEDAGKYYCTAYTGIYTLRSRTATVTVTSVVKAPQIELQPVAMSVMIGTPVFLGVKASGTATLRYQWQKDGVSVVGAMADHLVLYAAKLSDAGSYSVIVTNSAGMVESTAVTLSVTVAAPPLITHQPTSQRVVAGGGFSFSVVATGGQPLNYRWRKNGLDISGATSASFAINQAQMSDAGSYDVVVSNSVAPLVSAQITLVVEPLLITAFPAGITVTRFSPFALTIKTVAGLPLSYQWYRAGVLLPGETSDTLAVTRALDSDAKDYHVVVSNTAGTITSDTACVMVLSPPPAFDSDSDGVSDAAEITDGTDPHDPASVDATSRGLTAYYPFAGDARDASGYGNDGVLIGTKPTADRFGRIGKALLFNGSSDKITAAHADQIDSLPLTVACWFRTDNAPDTTVALLSKYVAGSWNGWHLGLGPLGPKPDETAITTLSGWYVREYINTVIGGYGNPSFSVNGGLNDGAWHHAVFTIDPNVGGRLYLDGQMITELPWTGSAQPPTLKYPLVIGYYPGAQPLYVGQLPYFKGAMDEVRIYDRALDQSQVTALYTQQTATPIVIATQPLGQSLNVGASALFQVVVSGNGPFSYQWRKNGLYIAGATNATYRIERVSVNDEGIYTVVMSNLGNRVVSETAVLTVLQPPAVTSAPAAVGMVGFPFRYKIEATNLPSMFTSSALPIGLSLDAATGLISGVPTTAGSATVYVTASNAYGTSPSFDVALSVAVSSGASVLWQQRTSGTDGYLRGVAWSGSKFVAVGDGGIRTSTDGVKWVQQTILEEAGRYTYFGITYGGGQFVAVGQGGFIVTSSDGESWIGHASGNYNLLLDVKWNGSQYVAVGASGTIATSPNGATWTLQDSGTVSQLNAVVWAGGQYVAVGSGGVVLTSGNGGTWITRFSGTARELSDVEYNGSQYLAVGEAGTILSSLDGITWSSQNSGSSLALSVVRWTGRRFLAGGFLGELISSADGFSWRSERLDAGMTNELDDMVIVGDQVLAVGGPGSIFSGVLAVSPPAIVVAPVSLTILANDRAQLKVIATGTGVLNYQWYQGSTAGMSNIIYGATSSTLTTPSVNTSSYFWVQVTDAYANVTNSPTATVSVSPSSPLSVSQAVLGNGYIAGGAVTITNTITCSSVTTSRLDWATLLPTGWKFISSTGSDGNTKPQTNTSDLLEWSWTTVSASPITFTYTVIVPLGVTNDEVITAMVTSQQSGNVFQTMAKPDPLIIRSATIHSADGDRNGRISLSELTRVIELYNTRNGSTRTGCYVVAAVVTEDGFAPDPSRGGSLVVTFPGYHSADEDRNGRLSLTELTRMIELYNTRSGTTRTGQYHVQVGTEDGFAPGP